MGPRACRRIADRQAEALRASRETFIGAGTVRTLSPGTTFTLGEHSAVAEDESFVVLRALHLAHNNLSAEVKEVAQRLGENPLARLIEREQAGSLHATGKDKGERPLYRNRIDAIRSSVPYRSADSDGHGLVLRPKPTVRGQQTAFVVGPPGAVIHTDASTAWGTLESERVHHRRYATRARRKPLFRKCIEIFYNR
ncbi:contractile injection system protein, VgrG/Pvc8 family [Pseudoduganella albidiflava]|nr:contractile injection system protein, VgrG/Pvc8 family [Pseudoduganella albidiflava]QBI04602.1 hypothetical protein EYF70_30090 [Pseudoduganella albidiflava]